MTLLLSLLNILLAAIPVLAIADGASERDIITIAAALLLAISANAPNESFKGAVRLLKPFWPAILFPVLWMLFQVTPLPVASIVNPIWSTASIALNDPSLTGRISIDPENTLLSLLFYTAVMSIMMATTIVSRDRQKAETILFVVSAVTAFMSAEVLLNRLSSLAGIVPDQSFAAAIFVTAAALGSIANATTIAMAIERYLSRREAESVSSGPLWLRICPALLGMALCVAALIYAPSTNVLIATISGLLTIVFIAAVRRFSLPPWFSGIILAIFAAMAISLIAFNSQGNSWLLRFAAFRSPQTSALTERALADSRWPGSGVGSFAPLAGIYQDFGATPISAAITSSASIVIEWGQLAFVILIGFALQLFALLFFGALRRGRDWFFPAAAAAWVLIVFCEAFCDPSLLQPPIQIVTAVIVGLGLSQRAGRTSGLQN